MFSKLGAGTSFLLGIYNWNRIIATASRQTQAPKEMNLYMWILIIFVVILVIAGIFAPEIYRGVPKFFSFTMGGLGAILAIVLRKNKKVTGDAALDEAIKTAGYSYDPRQDIFYSNMDAWQRDMGYCRLYDESAAPLGMIIDCEPVYFEYENKRWMIEFWKGQYDLTTGCEIGIYTTKDSDIYIPSTFYGAFYYSADDSDQLYISYSLRKNGNTLFTREGRHWWLTGFKLGEFSEPSELVMYLNITFKNSVMRDLFVEGLKKSGYIEQEIFMERNTVGLKFERTHTRQPYTRGAGTDWFVQRKNKLLCDKYQEITGPYNNFPDKMKAIQEKAPELYDYIINIGRNKKLFDIYGVIKKYL
jgi:hypothetical protein